MDDKIDIYGVYDSGANVSLINSKLLKIKDNKNIITSGTNLKTINGVKETIGLTRIKIKIFNIEKYVDVYVINKTEFRYDFLIGLDIIKDFNLIQDENLMVSQKIKNNNYEEYKKNILP